MFCMAIRILSHPASGNIASVAWDSDDVSLTIQFHSGRTYKYTHVPEDIAMGFESALNANQYFRDSIKDMYEYEMVG
jgi:hypothetical protein